MSLDDHRCEAVVDADGMVLGHAHVSPDLTDEGRAASLQVVWAEQDAVCPEAASERGRRQSAGHALIRERTQRLQGDAR